MSKRNYDDRTRNNSNCQRRSCKDLQKMRELLENGTTINDIAKRFQTSRQIIGKYLNDNPADGYTLRMTYMYKQHSCTVIDVDF